MQSINIGATPNDGTGDPLRSAFIIVNDNFEELGNAIATFVTQSDLNAYLLINDFDSFLTYLDGALAGKANTIHTHTIAQVDGLTTALANKANLSSVNASIASINSSISSINTSLTTLSDRTPRFYEDTTETPLDVAYLNSNYADAPLGSRVWSSFNSKNYERVTSTKWISYDVTEM